MTEESAYQLLKPSEIIADLLENIFRIREILEVVIYLVGFATLLLMVLVLALSLRLRAREMETIHILGGQRGLMMKLISMEIGILLLGSLVLSLAAALLISAFDDVLISFIGRSAT
jgi:putative ABC transport system permease protein